MRFIKKLKLTPDDKERLLTLIVGSLISFLAITTAIILTIYL